MDVIKDTEIPNVSMDTVDFLNYFSSYAYLFFQVIANEGCPFDEKDEYYYITSLASVEEQNNYLTTFNGAEDVKDVVLSLVKNTSYTRLPSL